MNTIAVDLQIESFERRFGQKIFYFACHAALPIALTPELLYALRTNFKKDEKGNSLGIPSVAIARLLLSSFCEQIGYELYEMDKAVRLQLIERLKKNRRFGVKRIREISSFLFHYASKHKDYLSKLHRWVGLAYYGGSEAYQLVKMDLEQEIKNAREDSLEMIILGRLLHNLEEMPTEYKEELKNLLNRQQSELLFHKELEASLRRDEQSSQDVDSIEEIPPEKSYNCSSAITKTDIFMLIDQSGTMHKRDKGGEKRWDSLQEIVAKDVDRLLNATDSAGDKISDRIKLYLFNQPEKLRELTITDTSKISAIFKTNRPTGSSFIELTLRECLKDWLEKRPDSSKKGALILIYTDGELSDKKTNLLSLIGQANKQIFSREKLKILTIGIGDRFVKKLEYFQELETEINNFTNAKGQQCKIFSVFGYDEIENGIIALLERTLGAS